MCLCACVCGQGSVEFGGVVGGGGVMMMVCVCWGKGVLRGVRGGEI